LSWGNSNYYAERALGKRDRNLYVIWNPLFDCKDSGNATPIWLARQTNYHQERVQRSEQKPIRHDSGWRRP